mmetsp:Transcript_38394/g.88609  ORF Transcript_38394/g.88609 Transcript_38394/m.88609 type:complete len:649 (+) Transcript_38394:344-2290(+)
MMLLRVPHRGLSADDAEADRLHAKRAERRFEDRRMDRVEALEAARRHGPNARLKRSLMTLDSKQSDRIPPPPPDYAPGAWEANYRHRQVEMSRARTETAARDGPPTLKLDPHSNRRYYATNVSRTQSEMLPQWVAGCRGLKRDRKHALATLDRHKTHIALGFRALKILKAWKKTTVLLRVMRKLDPRVGAFGQWAQMAQNTADPRWRAFSDGLLQMSTVWLFKEARRRILLLKRVLLRMANGKLGAAWSKWVGENVVHKAALKWKKLGKALYLQTGLGFFSELVRRWKLLRRVLLRVLAGKIAAGWSRWIEVDRFMRRANDRKKWKQLAKDLFLKTGVGMFKELVRRWKLLRKVLLRVIAGKLGSGWSKWLEVYKLQRLVEDRATWKRLGIGIYKMTGLGMFSEVLRRWKLVRRVLLRCVNSKMGAGWSKWREVYVGEKNRAVWRRMGQDLYKKSTYGLFSEMLRVWKLLRRTLLRAANVKLAAGWGKWREVVCFRNGRLRKRQCDCVHKISRGLHCRCSKDKHLALRLRALRVNVDNALDGDAWAYLPAKKWNIPDPRLTVQPEVSVESLVFEKEKLRADLAEKKRRTWKPTRSENPPVEADYAEHHLGVEEKKRPMEQRFSTSTRHLAKSSYMPVPRSMSRSVSWW